MLLPAETFSVGSSLLGPAVQELFIVCFVGLKVTQPTPLVGTTLQVVSPWTVVRLEAAWVEEAPWDEAV